LLVPAGQARPGRGDLRRRHGWHRDQRADHSESLPERGQPGAVPDRRGSAAGLRRGGLDTAAGRPGPGGADHVDGGAGPVQRDAAGHLAGVRAVRSVLRRVRGVLRVPTLLPEDHLRAVARRCSGADGRVRGRGGGAMAAALGAGSGATFALIAKVTDPARVGGVTGLVGAAGGLGGFVPPLIMGYVYGRTDSYAIGLWLLAATAVLTLVLTLTVVRRTA